MNDETVMQKLQRENTELREELRKMLIIVSDEFSLDDDRSGMAFAIANKYKIDIT